MNILKINDVSEDRIEKIFALADKAARDNKYKELKLNLSELSHRAASLVLANIFFEPSTRTRLSFDVAMQSLGGKVITVANGVNSSATKGETLRDTLMTVSQYADIIVTRTKEPLKDKLLELISVPIINAGDGAGEHPTQALLDFYTIRRYFKNKFSILFLGDLKYSRTVHSLIPLLARYDCKMYHCCHNTRDLPIDLKELSERVESADGTWKGKILPNIDVVYCTREQTERTIDRIPYYSTDYGFKTNGIDVLKKDAILMHPLPRGAEIPISLDKDHRAKYFEQANNGVYVRMGILQDALGL